MAASVGAPADYAALISRRLAGTSLNGLRDEAKAGKRTVAS
jgi:hypothetical protein